MGEVQSIDASQPSRLRMLVGRKMSTFREIITIGFDKNGEADFRINMSIAEVDRPKMEELTRMMPWAIKEALSLWLAHGPPSKEQQGCAGAKSLAA